MPCHYSTAGAVRWACRSPRRSSKTRSAKSSPRRGQARDSRAWSTRQWSSPRRGPCCDASARSAGACSATTTRRGSGLASWPTRAGIPTGSTRRDVGASRPSGNCRVAPDRDERRFGAVAGAVERTVWLIYLRSRPSGSRLESWPLGIASTHRVQRRTDKTDRTPGPARGPRGRRKASQRVRDKMRQLAEQGRSTGGRLFGYETKEGARTASRVRPRSSAGSSRGAVRARATSRSPGSWNGGWNFREEYLAEIEIVERLPLGSQMRLKTLAY
jgi:hypothetical protein